MFRGSVVGPSIDHQSIRTSLNNIRADTAGSTASGSRTAQDRERFIITLKAHLTISAFKVKNKQSNTVNCWRLETR